MKFLLTLSLGPVQDFIAAARKTADLYAGSDLLVSVARAVTLHLGDHGQLIFPADPKSDGANKILILLEEGKDPAALASSAKQVAQDTLEEFWAAAFQQLHPEQRALTDEPRARAQLSSFLEVYAAWWLLESEAGYSVARKSVDRLLAGRKALRDFEVIEQQDEGIPKSPLDPARACVFKVPEVYEALKAGGVLTQSPLNLKGNEFLDAVSLLKRTNGSSLKTVLNTHTLAHRSITLEAKNRDEDDWIPGYAYFAVLVADGDRMGAKISVNDTLKAHQTLSKNLDEFAKLAQGSKLTQGIVDKHHGFCVYAGGDDVLAFLPVTTAVQCARELARAFEKAVQGTLSVGVAIVHYREPLSVSLEQARAAEKAAKNKAGKTDAERGNRLALALHTRGGAPLEVVYLWDDLKLLENALNAYATGAVSRGFPYELRELALGWPPELETVEGMEVLNAETRRILKRKRVREGAMATLELPTFSTKRDLERYADTLILARFLSRQTEMDHA